MDSDKQLSKIILDKSLQLVYNLETLYINKHKRQARINVSKKAKAIKDDINDLKAKHSRRVQRGKVTIKKIAKMRDLPKKVGQKLSLIKENTSVDKMEAELLRCKELQKSISSKTMEAFTFADQETCIILNETQKWNKQYDLLIEYHQKLNGKLNLNPKLKFCALLAKKKAEKIVLEQKLAFLQQNKRKKHLTSTYNEEPQRVSLAKLIIKQNTIALKKEKLFSDVKLFGDGYVLPFCSLSVLKQFHDDNLSLKEFVDSRHQKRATWKAIYCLKLELNQKKINELQMKTEEIKSKYTQVHAITTKLENEKKELVAKIAKLRVELKVI